MAIRRPSVESHDWCHTAVEDEPDVNHRMVWTIDRFHRILESFENGKSIESKEFCIHVRSRDTLWKLVLTPCGKEHQGFVALHLQYLGIQGSTKYSDGESVKASVEFSLLDSTGNKDNRKQLEQEFPVRKSAGFTKFVSHASLHSGNYLAGQVLSIHCKVSVKGSISVQVVKSKPKALDQAPDLFGLQMLEMLHSAEEEGPDQVILVMRDGWIPCHTFPLSARSPVFRAMFNNEMREKTERKVEIEDMDVECGRNLLHYIYTGRVQQGANHQELLSAAEKYNLPELKEYCECVLSESLTVDSCLQLLLLSDNHSATKLKEALKTFILEHRAEFVLLPDWRSCLEARPALFSEIFQAVVTCTV